MQTNSSIAAGYKYYLCLLWFGVLFVPMFLFGGCNSNANAGKSQLESPDLTIRIMAIKQSGESKAMSDVPLLVNCLSSDDKSVRFYAIEALERITDTNCGYDYKSDPQSRSEAIKCWQDFIKSNELDTGGK